MARTTGVISVDPQGRSVVVDVVDGFDVRAVVYTTDRGVTAHTLPLTITDATDFYVKTPGDYTVSAKIGITECLPGSRGKSYVGVGCRSAYVVGMSGADAAESAAGGLPSWFQSGAGSPVGVVTPSQQGAVYQDTANGAWYEALGPTDADWVCGCGGGDFTVPGVSTQAGRFTVVLAGPGGNVELGDVAGYSGSGNGFFWNAGAGDGDQRAFLQVGPAGAHEHLWQQDGSYQLPVPAPNPSCAAQLGQTSPVGTITSGALPTLAVVSGVGAQVSTARDVELNVPVTYNPTGIATSTVKIELSPDGVTYSTLATNTVPALAALAGLINDVAVRVPAGWYVRLTATNATLATATYY